MKILAVLLLFSLGGARNSQPFDSAEGMPEWAFWVGLFIVSYIVYKVYISFQKDKRKRNLEIPL